MFIRLVILSLICLIFFNAAFAQKNYYSPKYSIILDTAKGIKCLKQCSRATPLVDRFFKLTGHDSIVLIRNFKQILKQKSSAYCYINMRVNRLDGFCYQYLGVIINQSKYIYLNVFKCNKEDLETFYKNWRTEPIIICDGGTDGWGVLFDIENGSFSQLAFNGIG